VLTGRRALGGKLGQSGLGPIHSYKASSSSLGLRTNLVGWFMASAGAYTDVGASVPAITNGDLVYVWQDQSGSGNHFIQATSGSRPVFATNVRNGNPALTCSSKTMSLAGNVTMNACTLFVVAKDNTSSSLWVGKGTDTESYLYTSNIVRFKSGSGTQIDTSSFTANLWHIAQGRTNGTTCNSYYNASLTSADQANTEDFIWRSMGLYNGSALINASIAEILIYNASLTASEMATVRTYLNGKYLIY